MEITSFPFSLLSITTGNVCVCVCERERERERTDFSTSPDKSI